MKPGTNGHKRETMEEFAARMGKEFREEAARIKKATEIHANREAQRIKREGEEKVKHLRKVASQFDGKRS